MLMLPTVLTLLRILLVPFFMFFFWSAQEGLSCAVMIFTVACITDFLDGYMARRLGVVSSWGAFWDPVADKILIGAVFICFVIKGLVPWWVVALMFIRDSGVTQLRIMAQRKGLKFKTQRIAKIKTFVQMMVIYSMFLRMAYPCDPCIVLADMMMYLMVALIVYTGCDYAFRVWFMMRRRI